MKMQIAWILACAALCCLVSGCKHDNQTAVPVGHEEIEVTIPVPTNPALPPLPPETQTTKPTQPAASPAAPAPAAPKATTPKETAPKTPKETSSISRSDPDEMPMVEFDDTQSDSPATNPTAPPRAETPAASGDNETPLIPF